MRVKVQVMIRADNGGPDTIHEIAILEKDCQRIEQLGLTLAEAKQLLTQLQQHLVTHQAVAFVKTRLECEACGAPLRRKEQTTRVLRTLFGTVLLTSPRLYQCRCQPHTTITFRPLTELLTTSTTPELLFLETKWASLISYGMTARLLKDFLPLDETLNATTIQNHTLAVAQRCEEEVEEDQDGMADSCPGDEGPLSLPKGHSLWDSTAGMSGTGSRNSATLRSLWAKQCRPISRPNALVSSRATIPKPNGGWGWCCSPKACRIRNR